MDVATQLLAEMSVPDADQRRVRMSWVDYLALPDELFAEWVDGEVVVSPRPANIHGAIVARMTVLLGTSLPGLELITEGGLLLPANRLRGPDVMVLTEMQHSTWVEDPPLLVVEVLSPSTRAEDTIRKAPEYAAARVGQFWVVDPEACTIDVYENVDGVWDLLLHLDEAHPRGEVIVGEHGTVPLDLGSILPRR